MRAVVRCVLAGVGIAAGVVAGPSGVSLAAAAQSHGFVIASVLTTWGQVAGMAHPVVVTFAAPVADRHAVERAMTGEFVWLDNEVVQWVPNRFWPAHNTVALSVGGATEEFQTGPAVVGVFGDHGFE